MTLSTTAGLGLAAYLAFFSNHSQVIYKTDQSHGTYSSHIAPASKMPLQHALAAVALEKPSSQPRAKPSLRGPWSAGNDQIYANLTMEELAQLGIAIKGDTIFSYKRNDHDSVERFQFSEYSIPGIKYKGHSIGGAGIFASAPAGIDAPKIYPILMTFANGNGAAYRIEVGKRHECALIAEDNINKDFRAWLEKPGTPGLHAFSFDIRSIRTDSSECDTITISIGKNLAQPYPFPLIAPEVDSLSQEQKNALIQLAHYYDGSSATKPAMTLPKNITLAADTVTAQNLLDELDQEENSSVVQHLRSTMARLNELVPVIVRVKPGTGAPDSSDFIFWYEPSDELFAALPPTQAEAFRKKLAEPPQCLNAPEAVTSEAQVTYCVSEEQQVNVRVFDLMGHIVKSETQHAEAGDNIAKINTESLPSGMYIILVQDNDGGERTRRIWVQNANPK